MRYLLDSNVFIEAKNRYYGFDICPGFWKWLEKFGKKNKPLSVKKVKEELLKQEDDLARWVSQLPASYFVEEMPEIQKNVQLITNYILSKSDRYNQAESNKFLSGADPWLIAAAKHYDSIVVTQEAAVTEISHKIKIPNVCLEFDVEYTDIFTLLRKEKVSFNLD